MTGVKARTFFIRSTGIVWLNLKTLYMKLQHRRQTAFAILENAVNKKMRPMLVIMEHSGIGFYIVK